MSELDVSKEYTTFMLRILSPDGDAFSGRVISFFVRTTEGDMAVLPGHAPMIAVTVPCACRFVTADDDGDCQVHVIRVTGGLLSVDGDNVALLASREHKK